MHVVFHKDTTRYLCNHPKVRTNKEKFATESAAAAALTREVKNGAVNRADFYIVEASIYHAEYEKTETVKSLMSGSDVVQSVNTPLCCDPSSETYWSM